MSCVKLFSVAFLLLSQTWVANSAFSDPNNAVKRNRNIPKMVLLPVLLSNDLDLGVVSEEKEEVEEILPFTCDCAKGPCRCCGDMEVSRIHLKEKTCIALDYLGEKAALKVTITSKKAMVFEDIFAADDIPPICVSYPGMSVVADVCFKFHDNQLTRNKMHTCMMVTPRILMQPITDVEIGCVTVKSSNGEEKPTVTEEGEALDKVTPRD